MKKIKRGLSILLAVAMVLSGVMVPGEKAKADEGATYNVSIEANVIKINGGSEPYSSESGFFVYSGDKITIPKSLCKNGDGNYVLTTC